MFGLLILAFIYWWIPGIGARHAFTGPKCEDNLSKEELELRAEENVHMKRFEYGQFN